MSHFLSQLSRSAYSVKQSGKFFSSNRSKMAGSFALACATNDSGGIDVLFLAPVHGNL